MAELFRTVCRYCAAGFLSDTHRDYCGMERCEIRHLHTRLATLEQQLADLRKRFAHLLHMYRHSHMDGGYDAEDIDAQLRNEGVVDE